MILGHFGIVLLLRGLYMAKIKASWNRLNSKVDGSRVGHKSGPFVYWNSVGCILFGFRIIWKYWLFDRNMFSCKAYLLTMRSSLQCSGLFMVFIFGESCSLKLCIKVIFEWGKLKGLGLFIFLSMDILSKAIYEGDNWMWREIFLTKMWL